MARAQSSIDKVAWSGRIVAVQSRIRLTRSFDERQHSYQGYVLRIDGTCGGQDREVLIAIGEGAHKKTLLPSRYGTKGAIGHSR
jgi:hypothetical protein